MKKIYLLAAVAISMFAACSSNEDLVVNDPNDLNPAEVPVGFDAYAQRGTTRAGAVNDVNLAHLQTNGFGVFAYYTDNNEYDGQVIPNFMYNQKVFGNPFAYTPVKYWPNEYGTSAVSDDADKVSFFAYAPWVDVVPSTGKPTAVDEQTWGITLLSRNNATGDPLVKYIASFNPTQSVDLCWGVADGETFSKAVDGSTQLMTEGMPWLNVMRPDYSATEKVKFTFKHALAKLNVQIDADVDVAAGTHTHPNEVDSKTKIWVRSVTFEGLATKGALNLKNDVASKAKWMDYNGTNDLVTGEEFIIFDGRKDGKEGTPGGAASNEKSLGLNPVLIQDGTDKAGVTKTAVNLFDSTTATDAVYVIPTGDEVKITIVYDVETEDGSLATYLSDQVTLGSSIENRIYKEKIFGDNVGFENGKFYTIKLHLGMNSVKFDAVVTDWVDVTAVEPDLPANNN